MGGPRRTSRECGRRHQPQPSGPSRARKAERPLAERAKPSGQSRAAQPSAPIALADEASRSDGAGNEGTGAPFWATVDCRQWPKVSFGAKGHLSAGCRPRYVPSVSYDWYMTETGESVVGPVGVDAADSAISDGGEAELVTSAVEVAEAWLAQLSDQIAVPASDVQDHLLDLWGVLNEGPAREEVERWLTETLRRNLYSVSDINERLETFLPV